MNQTKQDNFYVALAKLTAEQSHCTRAKVGAVVVTSDAVTLVGYNGTPSGQPNVCELDDKTLPEVLHAESNCLSKALNAGVSTKGATMYVTLAPCIDCSKLIIQAGISRVVYVEAYRKSCGLDLLKRCGVIVCEHDKAECSCVLTRKVYERLAF